jgi:hypothetical protein
VFFVFSQKVLMGFGVLVGVLGIFQSLPFFTSFLFLSLSLQGLTVSVIMFVAFFFLAGLRLLACLPSMA